jgi:hypothetical protein
MFLLNHLNLRDLKFHLFPLIRTGNLELPVDLELLMFLLILRFH